MAAEASLRDMARRLCRRLPLVKGLIHALPGHTVHTAQAKGWDTLSNGALLNALEAAGFELLLRTDRRIRHQQNLQGRRVALVVLTGTTRLGGRSFGNIASASLPL